MRHEGGCCLHPYETQPIAEMTLSFCCREKCKDVRLLDADGHEEKTHGFPECHPDHAPRFRVVVRSEVAKLREAAERIEKRFDAMPEWKKGTVEFAPKDSSE